MAKYGKRKTKISIDTQVVRLLSDSLLEQRRRMYDEKPDELHHGVIDEDFNARWVGTAASRIIFEVCLRFLDSGYINIIDVLSFEKYSIIEADHNNRGLDEILRKAIRVAEDPKGIEYALQRTNREALKADLHVVPNAEFISSPGMADEE